MVGQRADSQLDTLADLGAALGNDRNELWKMKNGYALLTAQGCERLPGTIGALAPAARDALAGTLRIGLHQDVEVTLPGTGSHRLTQVFGSALPISYGEGTTKQWEHLARLVLKASYEATLRAGVEKRRRTGNPRVFLTLLGGGAFGNPKAWILDAIARAVACVEGTGLDVNIVSFGRSDPEVATLVRQLASGVEASS